MTYKDSLRSTMVTHYFRMDGEAPRSEYWWFFVTYILSTVGMAIATAVLTVIADLDVLSVAQWGSWALLLIFFLPMNSLWVRRCRALGQAQVQSLGILAMVLALSLIAPIGGLNPIVASFGTWGLFLDVALGFAILYSVWVGLRSSRTPTE